VKRLLVAPILFAAVTASAAPAKVPLEIWGLEAADEVAIDGVAHAPKSGGTRVFAGDPTATNAPVIVELGNGKHEIVLRRSECAPRTFTVSLEGGTKRAIVLEKETVERCAIPLLPARRN